MSQKLSIAQRNSASDPPPSTQRNMKGEEKEGYRIFGTSRLFHDRTLRSNREGPSATVGGSACIGMATG
ncbi:hypothetical protein B296_00021461 [Ensete ventricosum]|uniref:Uncharacterized protein n=1 Tax=Ensete ventricosum TaxID=4639 RepID=A0A427APY8_ENSVE|nr:hypothetical protein B296_00021461 [Ensete ventricosum]